MSSLGFKCEVNIDTDTPSRPGTALIWRDTLPVSDVGIISECRAQVAFLKGYALLNIYAPSGTDKRLERAHFFSQDIFRGLSLAPHKQWVIGGDFNTILSPMDA